MADLQTPHEALRASMERLRSWSGSEGDRRQIRRVTAEVLRLIQDLIEGKDVQFEIQVRALTGHAHQAFAEYALIPDPPGTKRLRMPDGLYWFRCVIDALYYAGIAQAPKLAEGFNQRRRFPSQRLKKAKE